MKGMIPSSEPYTAMAYTIMGDGGETVAPSVLAITGNDAIVDWIFVELRDAANPSTILHTRAALLQRDGDIVDTDGVSALTFSGALAGTYHVAVRHRNHLGAMTLNAVNLSSTPLLVDFTNLPTYGTDAQVDLGGGFMALWGGDGNGDSKVSYQGKDSDLIPTTSTVYSHPNNGTHLANYPVQQYARADINMDGFVQYLGGTESDRLFLEWVIAQPNSNVYNEKGYVIEEQLP